MALHVRPRRPAPRRHGPPAPAMFALVVDFWQLSPALATGFWGALTAARWSQAVNWRQQLLLFQALKGPQAPAVPSPLLYAASSASETIAVVEALCTEGRLTRRDASRVQDAILRRVGPAGQWGFQAGAVGPEAPLDLAAVIEEYWR